MAAFYHSLLHGLTLLHVLIGRVPSSDAFYHLATENSSCQVVSTESEFVDLVCRHIVPSAETGACVNVNLTWHHVSHGKQTDIVDSDKFAVWDTVVDDREYLSLLRVNKIDGADIGRYQCTVQCHDTQGLRSASLRHVDLCLEQPRSNHAICGIDSQSDHCRAVFGNGVCDSECDNSANLFDGFDCADRPGVCTTGGCDHKFSNHQCDQECNNVNCMWDGGDCLSNSQRKYAKDTAVLILKSDFSPGNEGVDLKKLSRELSRLMQTFVRVLPDDLVTKKHALPPGDEFRNQDLTDQDLEDEELNGPQASFPDSRLYLVIDNSKCWPRCFNNAEQVAAFIQAALNTSWDPSVPIATVGVLSQAASPCPLENNTLLNIHHPSPAGTWTSRTLPQSSDGEQPWLVIGIAAVGGFLLIVLSLAAFLIRRVSKKKRKQKASATAEVDRIRASKESPAGVDV